TPVSTVARPSDRIVPMGAANAATIIGAISAGNVRCSRVTRSPRGTTLRRSTDAASCSTLLLRAASDICGETPPMTVYRPTFISHAHADNALCDRYADALQARGVPLYYDRANPQVGHKLGEMLEQELIRAHALVVLVTPAALATFWVGEEIEMYFNLM